MVSYANTKSKSYVIIALNIFYTHNLIANMRVCVFGGIMEEHFRPYFYPLSVIFKGNLKYHKYIRIFYVTINTFTTTYLDKSVDNEL